MAQKRRGKPSKRVPLSRPDAIQAPTVTATNTLQPPHLSDEDKFPSPTATTDERRTSGGVGASIAETVGVAARVGNSAAVSSTLGTTEPVPISASNDYVDGYVENGYVAEAVEFGPGANGRQAQHEEMLSRIAVLERLLAEQHRPGIGHNRPPELIEGSPVPFSEEDVREIKKASALLKAQPVVPKVPDEAQAAASTLKKIGERLGAYLDTFLSEAAKSAGNEFGKRVVRLSYWLALAATLMNLAQSVAAWLH